MGPEKYRGLFHVPHPAVPGPTRVVQHIKTSIITDGPVSKSDGPHDDARQFSHSS